MLWATLLKAVPCFSLDVLVTIGLAMQEKLRQLGEEYKDLMRAPGSSTERR